MENLDFASNMNYRTDVTEEDLANAWIDEYGVTYSNDRTKLLKGGTNKKCVIREGTTLICDSAFYGCAHLIEVIMPDSVKIIGCCAFELCEKLEKINFSNKLQIICESAFECCESLNRLTIPDTVVIIETNTFAACSNLKYVYLSENLQIIPERAFSECYNLESVILPKNLKQIEKDAFSECYDLINIDIPQSVEAIGHLAFDDCSKLDLFIPSTVKVLEGYIGCNYSISSNSPFLCYEDGVLYNKEKTSIYSFECKYDYEDGKIVGKIPQWAIRDSGSREVFSDDEYEQEWVSHKSIDVVDLVIPETIESIGNYAFCGVPYIRSVVIPKMVKHLGRCPFDNCESLERVHLPKNFCTSGVVKSFDRKIDIIVPKGYEENLNSCNLHKVHIDYEEFVHSNLDGVLYTKDEVSELFKYGYIYNVRHYLDNDNAISVFDNVIGRINWIMEKMKKKEEDYSNEICILLDFQKNKLETIRDSIIED